MRRLRDTLPALGFAGGAGGAWAWGLGSRWVALLGAFAVVWGVLALAGAFRQEAS